MTHAFISYVTENTREADFIAQRIAANGIDCWTDWANMQPGLPFRSQLRRAIQEGAFYIPLFSKAWMERNRSVANEELVIAIEELRLRPQNRTWFIPLRIDDGEVPDREIGGGQTLRDLHWIDFRRLGWRESLVRLIRSLGVPDPALDVGEPLGAGFPAQVEIQRGEIVFASTIPELPQFRGMVFTVSGGYCTRDANGNLCFRVDTRAPNEIIQRVNEMLGLASFSAVSQDRYISKDANIPNVVGFERVIQFPAGTLLYNPATATEIPVTAEMTVTSRYEARGYLTESRWSGNFEATATYALPQGSFPVGMNGGFWIDIAGSYRPS